MLRFAGLLPAVVAIACSPTGGGAAPPATGDELVADAVAATVSGTPGAYQLAVTVRSPDTGCDRYANWWEVTRLDGTLVHRRILRHSHVDEQPFTRSGGPIALGPDDEVIVRAHMHPGGYGGAALRGTPRSGFSEAPAIDAQFAPALASTEPLPTDCAF